MKWSLAVHQNLCIQLPPPQPIYSRSPNSSPPRIPALAAPPSSHPWLLPSSFYRSYSARSFSVPPSTASTPPHPCPARRRLCLRATSSPWASTPHPKVPPPPPIPATTTSPYGTATYNCRRRCGWPTPMCRWLTQPLPP